MLVTLGNKKAADRCDMRLCLAVLGTVWKYFGRRYWSRTSDLYDVNVAL